MGEGGWVIPSSHELLGVCAFFRPPTFCRIFSCVDGAEKVSLRASSRARGLGFCWEEGVGEGEERELAAMSHEFECLR